MRAEKRDNPLQEQFLMLKKATLIVLGCSLFVLVALNSRTVIKDINQQKIEFVSIEGDLNNVTENDIKSAVFTFINQSMVAIDLLEIKTALEQNAWIKAVSLRRKWPDTLIINVTEEIAIARWGNTKLLNREGALFTPLSISGLSKLANLSGPENSEKIVMEQYQIFNQLLYPKNLRISSLTMNVRGAWTMQINNGITVTVGSIRPVDKIRRFARIYESLFAGQIASIEGFDLRYEDGIAVNHKSAMNDTLLSMQAQ